MMKKIAFISYSGISIIVLATFMVAGLLVICEAATSIAPQSTRTEQKNSNAARTAKTANRNQQRGSPGASKAGRGTQAQSIYKVKVIVVDPDKKPVDEAEVWSPIGVKPSKVDGAWRFDIPAASKPKDGKLLFCASQSAFLWGESELPLSNNFNLTVTIELSGEKGIMQVQVVDISERPMEGIMLVTTGLGAIGERTNSEGMARIRLPNQTKQYELVELTIVDPKSMDLVFLSPHNRKVRVPAFENRSENVVPIMLGPRGDRDLLIANNNSRLAIALRVNEDTASKSADGKLTEERKKASLASAENEFGLKAGDADKAIRALGKETRDPYEQGIAALYAEDYPKAIMLLGESLKQREEEEKNEATSKAKANVAEVARFFGQALYEQARYSEAVDAYQKASEREPEDITILNSFGLALSKNGQHGRAGRVFEQLLEVNKKTQGADRPGVALALHNLATSYGSQGKYAQAEILLNQALTIKQKALRPDDPDLALTIETLALIYIIQGKHKESEDFFDKAMAIKQKALEPDDPGIATSLDYLALLRHTQGRFAEAETLQTQAIKILEKAPIAYQANLAISLDHLAETYRLEGKFKEAEDSANRALLIKRKLLRSDHPNIAEGLSGLAGVYISRGKYDEAEELLTEALAIWEKTTGLDNPNVTNTLNSLALIYQSRGKYDEAEELLKESLAIWEKTAGPDNPTLAVLRSSMAGLYLDWGKFTKVKPLASRALASLKKMLGPNHPDLAHPYMILAKLYNIQGSYSQAEAHCKQALATIEKAYGKDHVNAVNSLQALTTIYEAQEANSKAQPIAEQILRIQEKALGLDHPEVGVAQNNLAYNYYLQGKYDEARPHAERAVEIFEKNPNDNYMARILETLASILSGQREYAQAEAAYKRSLKLFEKLPGSDIDNAITLRGLAKLYNDLGLYSEAETRFKRAIEIHEKLPGVYGFQLAKTLKEYASLLRKTQREPEAARLEKQARAIKIKQAQSKKKN